MLGCQLQAESRLRQLDTELVDRIAERTAALETAAREAEQANLAKSRFLAAASHDLRQPLQTLFLLHGHLARTVEGERAQKLVARLDATLGAMSGMLNALLDLNRIEAGEPVSPLGNSTRSFRNIISSITPRANGAAVWASASPSYDAWAIRWAIESTSVRSRVEARSSPSRSCSPRVKPDHSLNGIARG